jgi:uncharacterized repeat protein (TIGR01451 family)
VGDLAPGESGAITVVMTVTDLVRYPSFTNTVAISTTTGETTLDDNRSDEVTLVPPADVEIVKEFQYLDAPPGPGSTALYTLTCSNPGTIVARDVVVTDTLPDQLEFVRATPEEDGFIRATNTLTWSLGSLEAGDERTILVETRVRPDLIDIPVEGITVTNNARIDTSTTEVITENNQSYVETYVDLIAFTVQAVPDAIWVRWETAVEIDTWGFYVYRSETDRFEDAEMIAYRPGAGHGQAGGAQYQYKDLSIVPEATYHYWLVEEDTAGWRTRYGPQVVTALPEMLHHSYISFVEQPLATGAMSGESTE